jgi:BirA family transcriptional regulator, biotin operon repressor / biotin---[acetyl-CoA-carboxylase] ligase
LYKIPATTLFLGKNLIFVPECHSTNDLMLQVCQKESPVEGTIIITAYQTAGRGQRGNVWIVEPGKNLTFTLLFKPAFLAVHKQFYLNIFISLGIRDYITELTGRKVHIKWPNDVLIDDKKVCGVLIENQVQANKIGNSFIGIGLNVNQQDFSLPFATSILKVTGEQIPLSNALESLLKHIEVRYLQLKSQQYQLLLFDYLRSLYGLNERRWYEIETAEVEGTITGLDDFGRLLLNVGGVNRTFDIKEIKYLPTKSYST